MAFNDVDLYLTSGTNVLQRGDWTDTVYKYDSSSFYNWEQDNLPLHDLEERTELNWEQHGYPGSSLQGGMMLTVSDTGADAAPPYQVFSTVSGALEKLPRVLRFPVIIEVAASGDLGDVDISDFEFVDDGGLEIINRGFARLLSGSATASFETAASGTNTSSISNVSSLDLSNTFADTSALATSSNLTTINSNDFWNTYHRSFFRVLTTFELDGSMNRASMGSYDGGTGTDHRPNGLTATVKQGTIDAAGFLTADGNTFGLDDYLDQASGSDYNATATSFALRESDTADLDAFNNVIGVGGYVYANTVRTLKVRNCNGPVYVRGFCVDGYRGTTIPAPDHEIETGITVKNAKVVIENCAVMRCSETGILIDNSDVILNRGFTSYRNYPLTSDTKGTATAYGMRAFNSTVTLSATNNEAYGMPADSPYSFAHNPVGMQLNNSVLTSPVGGRTTNILGDSVVGAQHQFHQINLDLFLNTKTGLECNNSIVDFNHTIFAFQNENGISMFNTKFHTDELVVDHNNNVGIEATNSDIKYFKVGNATTGAPNKVLQTVINGIHMKFRNTTLDFEDLPTNYLGTATVPTNFLEICSGGRKTENGLSVPGVQLDSSKVRLLNTETQFDTTNHTPATLEGVPITGFCYKAENNSNLQFLGTSGQYTYIMGPDTTYDTLLDSVAIMAEDGSKVEFNGPTVMNSAGVNVGARNNSTILFAPHNTEGRLEITDWSLSDSRMHTMVDLQSFRSCLSVDNNSTLKLKDLGDYNELWGRSSDAEVLNLITSSDYNPADVLGQSTYTSGGYMQFYPNPVVRGLSIGDGEFIPSAVANIVDDLDTPEMANTGHGEDRIPDTVSDKRDFWDHSWGGVCVRATGGSNVDVLNTHFLTGFNNVSSTILDVSAGSPLTTECGKVMIWNIADDSGLRASHVSVSGHYPGDVDYHGPSGFYVSADATCNGAHTVLSSAPSATLDTGRLSILDSFGQHPEVNDLLEGASSIAARDTFDNKGPFRIYFSVNPIAKFIGYTRGTNGAFQLSSNLDSGYSWTDDPSAVEVGEPYQEISQGYNPSRDCSTPYPTTLSSIYEELGFQLNASAGGQPLSTTFFYASGMLDDSYASRIWLDDSAMNTFANAKNATKGTSGRPKLVSYYRAIREEFGEGHTGDEGNDAGGFRNGFGLGYRSSNISDFDRDI